MNNDALSMKTYLKAHGLWEFVETCTNPPPLRTNFTIAQIKQHSEECAKKYKTMFRIQSIVSDFIL